MGKRILAIGDIHGQARTFEFLLDYIDPEFDDTVITLGDYVDGGPDSRGVLNLLLDLAERTHLIPLRGNHDVMMLNACNNRDDLDIWLKFGGNTTLESYPNGTIDLRHWRFLEQDCIDWYESAEHIFVHGHLDPGRKMIDQDVKTLHWKRIPPCEAHCSGKTVLCGHSCVQGGLPLHLGHTICIDTIGYLGGWLSCLDVCAGKLTQVNHHGRIRTFDLADIPRN